MGPSVRVGLHREENRGPPEDITLPQPPALGFQSFNLGGFLAGHTKEGNDSVHPCSGTGFASLMASLVPKVLLMTVSMYFIKSTSSSMIVNNRRTLEGYSFLVAVRDISTTHSTWWVMGKMSKARTPVSS